MIDALKTEIEIEFVWVPKYVGGHSHSPYEGMRSTIRWQKYIAEYLECSRDVECRDLKFDNSMQKWTATCSFSSDIEVPLNWTSDGELIELLGGYRVIAVGKILQRR